MLHLFFKMLNNIRIKAWNIKFKLWELSHLLYRQWLKSKSLDTSIKSVREHVSNTEKWKIKIEEEIVRRIKAVAKPKLQYLGSYGS